MKTGDVQLHIAESFRGGLAQSVQRSCVSAWNSVFGNGLALSTLYPSLVKLIPARFWWQDGPVSHTSCVSALKKQCTMFSCSRL